MSSHVRNLTRVIRDFTRIQNSLLSNHKNEYDRGFYNGLVLAMALMTDKEPIFLEKKIKKGKQ